jgi:putative ABC transport system permease protein
VLLLIGAFTIGLILSLLAFGVFISFRIFAFPDITADGSITLGGGGRRVLLVANVHPCWRRRRRSPAGALAGRDRLCTRGSRSTACCRDPVMTALYSINLHIMGRATAAASERTLRRWRSRGARCRRVGASLGWEVSTRDAGVSALSRSPARRRRAALLFFRSSIGTAMQAAGDNAQMIRALGVNVDNMIVLGLRLSNGLVAFRARCSRSIRGSPTCRWASAWWSGGWPASSSRALVGVRDLGLRDHPARSWGPCSFRRDRRDSALRRRPQSERLKLSPRVRVHRAGAAVAAQAERRAPVALRD